MKESCGKVYLVGAGCGEADLITIRGLECIRKCDVLIYDDLISEKLISESPLNAELIYMGKRSGRHYASQEEINDKIVAKALEGKTVCRLKGGDPFVFGRGGEEILALQKQGIPYEEVPGISSSIAIPAAAGIPVTHRKQARSFHVITAHSADTADGLPEDMDKYASLTGTLVFLMGLSMLKKISDRLIAAGKDPETPAAVISGGNSANPACVRGTLKDIPEIAEREGVKSPAVIVVSPTAAFDFSPTIYKPLTGVTIGITGTAHMADRLDAELSALGGRVIRMQSSRVVDLHPEVSEETLSNADWLVFTSGNGVKRFFEILRERDIDIRKLHSCRFAVIGAATKKILASYGIKADLCPDVFTGEALAEELKKVVSRDDTVLLLRSEKGSHVLPEELGSFCRVSDIFTYTVEADERTSALARGLTDRLNFLIFSSAGGVQAYRDTIGDISEKTRCLCIGPTAAQELKNIYGIDGILSDEISAESLVEKVIELTK